MAKKDIKDTKTAPAAKTPAKKAPAKKAPVKKSPSKAAAKPAEEKIVKAPASTPAVSPAAPQAKKPAASKKAADKPQSQGRRDAIKTLLGLSVAGVFGYGVLKKIRYEEEQKKKVDFLKFDKRKAIPSAMDGKQIRLGIIGFGIRGKLLMRALGFAEPEWIDEQLENLKENSSDTRYQMFMEQDDLNVIVTAVCDIFDPYGERAAVAGSNVNRVGVGGKLGPQPKRYRTYQELIAAEDVDAIVISTPDHWHCEMTIEAAKRGKHVYVEKPLSWTVPETYRVRDVVKQSGIVFQLGHQGRQTDSYIRAKEIVDKGMLGKISLIQVATNRNTPNGAWVYPIIEGASPETIDWKQFEGPAQSIREYESYMRSNKLQRFMGPEARDRFSLERFFRWRCWWDYSTGLSGDLLTHEYDAINQILGVGIPSSVTSSGGVYVYKDGRTVPDVLQTTIEFKDRDMTLLYSATQGNSNKRNKLIMGTDGTLNVSNKLLLSATKESVRYKTYIDEGLIKPDETFYTYIPGETNVDALTSPTQAYFAQRGLLYTYAGGRRYDTTHLHMREWLYCIRAGGQPSCDIDAAFDEAMAAHMGTRAYLEGRTMFWDKDKEEITRG